MIVNLSVSIFLTVAQGYPNIFPHLEPSDICADGHRLLVPHETDCSLFHFCEYGLKWKSPSSCPAGTLFQYELQICDFPGNVKCYTGSSQDNYDEDKYKQDEHNKVITTNDDIITKRDKNHERQSNNDIKYGLYKDKNNEANTIVTPEDNSVTESNDDDNDYSWEEYTDHFINNDLENFTYAYDDENSHETTESNDINYSTDDNLNEYDDAKDILANGCPNDGTIKLLPDDNDRGKYFICNFGKLVQMECSQGTQFNAKLLTCVSPQNSGWVSKHEKVGNSKTIIENFKPEVNNQEHNKTKEVLNSNIVKKDLEDKQINKNNKRSKSINHGKASNRSYVLDSKTLERIYKNSNEFRKEKNLATDNDEIRIRTGNNKQGDAENSIHQIIQDVKNYMINNENHIKTVTNDVDIDKNGKKGTGNGIDDVLTVRGDMDDEVINIKDSNGIDLLPNGCPANFTINLSLPHESDCEKYYFCHFGIMIEVSCGDGYHFNDELQGCDVPENSGCSDEGMDGNDYNSHGLIGSQFK